MSPVAFSSIYHVFLFLWQKKILLSGAVLFLQCIILYSSKPKWPLARLCGGGNGEGLSRDLHSSKPDPHPELDTGHPSYQILENTLLETETGAWAATAPASSDVVDVAHAGGGLSGASCSSIYTDVSQKAAVRGWSCWRIQTRSWRVKMSAHYRFYFLLLLIIVSCFIVVNGNEAAGKLNAVHASLG